MMKNLGQLPEIAVLRGGVHRRDESMEEGVAILRSLTARGYKPLDVVIDQVGEWLLQGVPTDAHYVFTRAHTVVDTTRDRHTEYKALAKRMDVALLLSHDDTVEMDRETMYRLLRQQGVETPDTYILRAGDVYNTHAIQNLWRTMHTPLMVRPLSREYGYNSSLIRNFKELEDTTRELHTKGVDVHILTYRPQGVISIAVLPSFRGQEVYTPLAVETFIHDKQLPKKDNPMRPMLHAGAETAAAIRTVAEKAYHAIGSMGHALIDMIPHKDSYIVVNIDLHPSLRANGRFAQSLQTTGADIGEYVHAHAMYDGER